MKHEWNKKKADGILRSFQLLFFEISQESRQVKAVVEQSDIINHCQDGQGRFFNFQLSAMFCAAAVIDSFRSRLIQSPR